MNRYRFVAESDKDGLAITITGEVVAPRFAEAMEAAFAKVRFEVNSDFELTCVELCGPVQEEPNGW